jgi:hypothetical protein
LPPYEPALDALVARESGEEDTMHARYLIAAAVALALGVTLSIAPGRRCQSLQGADGSQVDLEDTAE